MFGSSHILKFISPLLVVLSLSAAASNSGVTYQGRILKPDGTPVAGLHTEFKLQIRTPDSNNCLMYEEIQSQNLSQSNGSFSITINDGSGARTDSTLLTLDKIFANHGLFTFDPTTCTTGTGTYAPNSTDGRNLVVLFKDESMPTWEPIPAQKLNFVPFAFEAKQVSGFTPQSLVRVAESDGTLDFVSPLSNAQYTALLNLANGTSTAYTPVGQLNGSALPTMTSGQVLGWNGTTWVSTSAAPGSSSITQTMLQNNIVSTNQMAGDVTINTSGTLGSAVSTTRDFKIFTAGSGTGYLEMKAPAIPDGTHYTLTWPLNTGAVGQVLTTDGSGGLSWAAPTAAGITSLTGDVTASGTGAVAATVASVGGSSAALVHSGELLANAATSANTSGKIILRDGSGNFATNVVTANGVSLNNGGSILSLVNPVGAAYTLTLPGTAGSVGQFLATNGSGTTSWSTALTPATGFANGGNTFGAAASLGTSDNFDLTLKTNSVPRMTIQAGGNVGIGTTAPGAALDIVVTGDRSAMIVPRDVTTARPSVPVSGMLRYNTTSSSLELYSGSNWTNIQTNTGGSVGVTVGDSNLYTPGTASVVSPSGPSLSNFNSSATTGTGAFSVYRVKNSTNNNGWAYMGAVSNSTNSPTLVFGHADAASTTYLERMRISSSGSVGIGTTAPQATLDIAGTARLAVNTTQPIACSTANSGTVAVNSNFRFCICKGPSAAWVYTTDGTTACVW